MNWRSLAKKTEFHRVYEEGVKRVGRLLVVYLLIADDRARAVVASRKVGSAVKRNRAKRLLREALRNSLLAEPGGVGTISERFFPEPDGKSPDRSGKAGLWVVLVARQHILTANSRQVRAELDELLSA